MRLLVESCAPNTGAEHPWTLSYRALTIDFRGQGTGMAFSSSFFDRCEAPTESSATQSYTLPIGFEEQVMVWLLFKKVI